METKLSVPEILFLISVNPEKGGLVNNFGYTFELSLVAAFIMELHLKGNIEIVDNRIRVVKFDSDKTLERFILSKFEKFDRPLTIGRWINRIHFSSRYIRRELKTGLADRLLVRLEEKQFLFFNWTKPYLFDKMKAAELRSEIEKMVRSGEFNQEGKYIMSLLEPAGLMRRIFPLREHRRDARQRLKQLEVENKISTALKHAIAARRAAAAS